MPAWLGSQQTQGHRSSPPPADLQVKQIQSQRRLHLSDLATSPEEQQSFAGAAVQAKAAFEAAQQQVAQAEINLRVPRYAARSTATSPTC
jgi:hypothetical protein